MSARVRPRSLRRAVAASGAGALALAGLGGALLAAPVAAVHDADLFELDANIMDDAAVTGEDWSTLFDGDSTAFATTGIVPDPAPQSIFTGGGSKDDLDIPGWKHKNGSVPDKDDITNAYASAYTLGGDTYVYFGLDRYAVQGSADVGFWFFQDDVAPVPGVPLGSTSTFSGEHQVGDLLVLSEFDQGGTAVTIKVLEWVGTGGDEGGGTLLTLVGGADGTLADCDDVAADDEVCANVNTAPIPDAGVPWDYVGKGGVRDIPTGAFFEGGINLSAVFDGTVPCFTNFLAETRSSFEVNAVLKDLVHGSFPLCGADISIAPSAVNDVGESHTFTVTASKTFAGESAPADDGTLVDVTLTHSVTAANPVTVTADTCSTTGTVGGTCTITFTSTTVGTVTGHASASIAIGDETIDVETGSDPGENPDAVKRFVDAKITIEPDDVNSIGESHTFTVDVEKNLGDGNGFVAATEGHVDVTLTDAAGAVNTVDATASTCDETGDNLDANGQCVVVFTSATAGTVTGTATVTLTITATEGSDTLTRSTNGTGSSSDGAVKEFRDGSLTWLKNDDAGARLAGATFQVCRTHNLNTSTDPDTFDDITDVCVTVLDNSAADADPDVGEFLLEHLRLGRYTIDEVAPFPEGYEPDPDVETVDLTLEDTNGPTTPPTFVNVALYRLIVITCNTTTEELVDSTVDLDGDVKATVTAAQLGDIDETALCQLAGANYDNLTSGTYTPSVELPDGAPLFP